MSTRSQKTAAARKFLYSCFYTSSYTVTESSDRQGLRLDGPVIETMDGRYDIVSDAVVFGAIQVPGDGKPIVLLVDDEKGIRSALKRMLRREGLELIEASSAREALEILEAWRDKEDRVHY